MKSFKDILLEKLKVSTSNSVGQDMDYIDNLPLGEEKSNEVAEFLKSHYGDLFTEYRVMKTGNVKLGNFTNQHGIWADGEFTLAFYRGNYVMRRSTPRYGAVAKMADVPTFAELIAKFDKSLKKNGYL
jgi:hypothetical protein